MSENAIISGVAIDLKRIALGIRQPWAELILRGDKTIEVRSQNTRVRGTIYVYASRQLSAHPAAAPAIERFRLIPAELPRGVVVGTVDLLDASPATAEHARQACVSAAALRGQFSWRLANPARLQQPLAVQFLPYGVWFYPWQRRKS